MGISFYTRTHEYIPTSTGTRCKYCNSFSTVGDYFEYECKLRFNEKGFREFLEFRNISIIDKNTAIRRFTSDILNIKDLKREFKRLCSKEETKRIVNLKYRIEPKL